MNHSTGKRCPVLGVRIIKVFMCRIKNGADKWKSKLWEFLLVHCLRVCIWKGAGDDHLVLDSRFSRRWRCVCWSCGLQRPADLLPDNIRHPGAFSCRTNPRSDKYLTPLKLTTRGLIRRLPQLGRSALPSLTFCGDQGQQRSSWVQMSRNRAPVSGSPLQATRYSGPASDKTRHFQESFCVFCVNVDCVCEIVQ